MTSWATITIEIDEDAKKFTGPPTGLRIDKGNDEYGWVDSERIYALSYGRYQHKRYIKHVKEFSSPWFNGAWDAIICEVENTGDSVKAHHYRARQKGFDDMRVDGMSFSMTYDGKRWPDGEREAVVDHVFEETGIKPVIEPIETTTPPDMVLQK
jgi:hypothetical protein